jgi:predicted transcriptional regulator
MPIKLLKQNLEYFKYSNNIIKSVEIDTRFNDIVNYLNDEIIHKLNNLNDNIIVGSLLQTDINSILKSKKDAGYIWKK